MVPTWLQMEAKMGAKIMKIVEKWSLETRSEKDSKNVWTLRPSDPQKLSSRLRGVQFFTKSRGLKKVSKMELKWRPKWYPNRWKLGPRDPQKMTSKSVSKKCEKWSPKGCQLGTKVEPKTLPREVKKLKKWGSLIRGLLGASWAPFWLHFWSFFSVFLMYFLWFPNGFSTILGPCSHKFWRPCWDHALSWFGEWL